MSILTINLSSIRKNYRLLKSAAGDSVDVAGVVKANAYGCGVAAVAPVLYEEGARRFFVATFAESLELRTIIEDDADVYMLGGYHEEHGDLYVAENICPVLNSVHQVRAYAALAARLGKSLPAILHIDTGINRLGVEAGEVKALAGETALWDRIDLQFVMSHFACADEAGNKMNDEQFTLFKTLSDYFEGVPKSLANSSGVMRNADYHFDTVRPGMALYGLNPLPESENQMQPVVQIDGYILQVKNVRAGEVCGYGATYRFEKDTKLAIIETGYADGFLRHLSNKAALYWKGIPCPVRGRVSMDLTIVDLGGVPENDLPGPGDMMEILGPHQDADTLAESCGTIGYEILTSLSRRYKRIYED